MKFKVEGIDDVKELLLYDKEGEPLDQEQEQLELTGVSNWIHRRITEDTTDGVLHVDTGEFQWWKTYFTKMQARLFRLHHLKEDSEAKDDTALLYRIIEEEMSYDGNDHGDRRTLTQRVEDRLRDHFRNIK